MQTARIIILGVVILVIVGLIFYFESQKPRRVATEGVTIKTPDTAMNKKEKAKQYPLAKEITTPDGFINIDPSAGLGTGKISIGGLVGKKVVLVDFWTYSCINCQRTTPYLNAWYEKYKNMGLMIIGVHTPEFEFEKKYENVLAAVKKFNIQYPVVLDNDFSTWNAYGNRYWPRKYLIDIDGYIVYDHIGEGAYNETERKIQQLLEERTATLGTQENISKEITQSATSGRVDVSRPRSPEIYFGAARNLYLGNGKSKTLGVQFLKEPAKIKTNILHLIGDWDFQNEFAENKSGQAKIIFRYQAQDVYLVANSEKGIKARVLLDGQPLGKEAGEDVAQNAIFIKEDRLYKIIQSPQGWGEHTLELIIETPGLRSFTFTFG